MKDKVIIITGASSGIGKACALLFAENGANVVAVGRNNKNLNALLNETKKKSGTIRVHTADVCDTSQVEDLVNETMEKLGQIDCLVNSAGIIMNGTIENTQLSDWDRMLDINLRSVFYISQKCVPHLEKTHGNIVNVSSVAGTRAFPNILAYCVSKAAVDQLTRCAALELAAKGIRVNAVNPGVVVTSLHKRSGMTDEGYGQFLTHSENTHPLGRVGSPEEVADLIYFLASEKAGWITGATYEIDGGRAQTCAR